MTTLALPMPSPASPKRSYDDAGLSQNYPPDPTTSDRYASQPFHVLNPVDQQRIGGSAIPSIEFQNPTEPSVMPSSVTSAAGEKPAKRVKLSTEEKEAKRVEKEVRDRLRADEKSRKEEEKAKKDAEKAVKDEERRKVKEAKEEQVRLKEEEKQKKEEEKMKKARSQLRLNAFFPPPTNSTANREGSPSKSPNKAFESSPLSSRRSSIAEINAIELGQRSRSASVQATPSKSRKSDYDRHFPAFFLHSHTIVAPQYRCRQVVESTLHTAGNIDEAILRQDYEVQPLNKSIHGLLRLPSKRHRKRNEPLSLKEVIRKLNGSSNNPIDLTTNSNDLKDTLTSANLKIKFLKFAEDVRPPYIGTYTKTPKRGSMCSLAKNPFSRVRPDTNYDWDSEAEWEDAVDGEDLDSEGEEEDEDEDEEDMAGFLDDEDTNAVKRRPLLGDQEPQCSGICWQGESLSSNGKPQPNLNSYRIDILLENSALPIDPFSTIYWSPPPPQPNPSTRIPPTQQTLMEPPRIPLSPVNRSNALLKPFPPPTSTAGTNKPPKRFVDPNIMDEFKHEIIIGSNLTKMGLCEILKVKFPKQKKDAIKDTLEAVAERVGTKAAEKRWVLKGGI